VNIFQRIRSLHPGQVAILVLVGVAAVAGLRSVRSKVVRNQRHAEYWLSNLAPEMAAVNDSLEEVNGELDRLGWLVAHQAENDSVDKAKDELRRRRARLEADSARLSGLRAQQPGAGDSLRRVIDVLRQMPDRFNPLVYGATYRELLASLEANRPRLEVDQARLTRRHTELAYLGPGGSPERVRDESRLQLFSLDVVIVAIALSLLGVLWIWFGGQQRTQVAPAEASVAPDSPPSARALNWSRLRANPVIRLVGWLLLILFGIVVFRIAEEVAVTIRSAL